MFTVGIVAALRSKKLEGRVIGVMVTASHNPEEVSKQMDHHHNFMPANLSFIG
jgi:hypothetical protein